MSIEMDQSELSLLIYNHAVQLTLVGDDASTAIATAHRIALYAFDPEFFSVGQNNAREALKRAKQQAEAKKAGQAETKVGASDEIGKPSQLRDLTTGPKGSRAS